MMTSVLSGCTESSFTSTLLQHTGSNDSASRPLLVTKPDENTLSKSALIYYNNRGESIVDFTLELELVRNCLGKIALQRQTFQRRASIDSFNTNSSTVEIDSDIENSGTGERRVLPTNVSFLLKELDGCLDNMKKCSAYRSKKGSEDADSAGNRNKDKTNDRDNEVKSRNLWITQENIARVSSRFATTLKSAISDSASNSNSTSTALSTSSRSTHNQRHSVTLSEVYIAASWAGWVSKYCVNNHLFVPRKTWKRRFFVLTPKALYRFKSSAPSAISLEPIQITGNTVATISEKFSGRRWIIQISNPGHPACYMQVESLEELKIWLSSIKYAIIQSKYSTHKVSRERESLRDSVATTSTTSSTSSSIRSTAKLPEINLSQLPAATPRPNYPPPAIPSELSKGEQVTQRTPPFSSTAEPPSHRSLLQRVNILPKKEMIHASKNTTRKLLILDSNPTILINTVTPYAVEATH